MWAVFQSLCPAKVESDQKSDELNATVEDLQLDVKRSRRRFDVVATSRRAPDAILSQEKIETAR